MIAKKPDSPKLLRSSANCDLGWIYFHKVFFIAPIAGWPFYKEHVNPSHLYRSNPDLRMHVVYFDHRRYAFPWVHDSVFNNDLKIDFYLSIILLTNPSEEWTCFLVIILWQNVCHFNNKVIWIADIWFVIHLRTKSFF